MSDPFIFADDASATDVIDNLPELKEFAWDFVHDVFLYNSTGGHKIVVQNEALKVWIYKALKTERYRYQIYLHGDYNNDAPYGVELEQFIGRSANTPANAEKIKGYIEQGLAVNPYIVSINSIDITEQVKDKLTIAMDITSVYGDMSTEVTI